MLAFFEAFCQCFSKFFIFVDKLKVSLMKEMKNNMFCVFRNREVTPGHYVFIFYFLFYMAI